VEGVERGSMAAYVSEWNVGVKFHTASGQLDGIKGVHRVFMGGVSMRWGAASDVPLSSHISGMVVGAPLRRNPNGCEGQVQIQVRVDGRVLIPSS